ncbi:hypothetical protein CO165_02775 [Candidatus Roizmanbacteria bacterium CG_4_9_14_3_um_filter_33_18]|uniref:PqqD family protein n=1 Tax=Candidatus Roizmanbacteria bacterium CG_4_9_14_3_um_filter_33_18 TaxID=1974841 RepID=A0A2M7XXY9_9BACT|nr:MAG: hypothetical protein CO165_02775 [Candidatus Roizmanbacteria bacterium CG_4_9_14_3_um_filter_33_18]
MIKYKMNPSATYKVFDGEVHILDYKTANIHSLNSTASFIWKQLIKPTSEKALIEKMVKEFDVEEKELKKDLVEFFELYLENGFILKLND